VAVEFVIASPYGQGGGEVVANMAVVSMALVGVAITPIAISMVWGAPADTSCLRMMRTMTLPMMAGTTLGAVTRTGAASANWSTRLGGMLYSSWEAPHSRVATGGNTKTQARGGAYLCPPLPPHGRDSRARGYPPLLSRALKANKGSFQHLDHRQVGQLPHWQRWCPRRRRLNNKEAPRLRCNHPVGMVVPVQGWLRPPLAWGPMEPPPKNIRVSLVPLSALPLS
jgi:hypothetical protein